MAWLLRNLATFSPLIFPIRTSSRLTPFFLLFDFVDISPLLICLYTGLVQSVAALRAPLIQASSPPPAPSFCLLVYGNLSIFWQFHLPPNRAGGTGGVEGTSRQPPPYKEGCCESGVYPRVYRSLTVLNYLLTLPGRALQRTAFLGCSGSQPGRKGPTDGIMSRWSHNAQSGCCGRITTAAFHPLTVFTHARCLLEPFGKSWWLLTWGHGRQTMQLLKSFGVAWPPRIGTAANYLIVYQSYLLPILVFLRNSYLLSTPLVIWQVVHQGKGSSSFSFSIRT